MGWVERTTQRHTHIYIYTRYMYNIYIYIYICICIYTSNMHTSRYNSSADRNGCPCGFKQRVSVSICFGPLAYGPLLSSHAPIGDHPPPKKRPQRTFIRGMGLLMFVYLYVYIVATHAHYHTRTHAHTHTYRHMYIYIYVYIYIEKS